MAAARDFGADLVVDVERIDAVGALREAVGTLADVVVDVTAKAPAAFVQAIRLARAGGTIVVAGTRGSRDIPGFDPDLLVYKELRIVGTLGVDAPAYRAALDLLATKRFPFAELLRRTANFAEMPALLRDMAGEGDAPPVHAVFVPH